MSSENSASIFNTLSDLPSQLEDGALVLGEAVRLAGSLSQDTLDTQRHKHLAYILAEQTQLNSNNTHTINTNLNKVSTHTHTQAHTSMLRKELSATKHGRWREMCVGV